MKNTDMKPDTRYVVTKGNSSIPKGSFIERKVEKTNLPNNDELLLVFGKNGGFFLKEDFSYIFRGLQVVPV